MHAMLADGTGLVKGWVDDFNDDCSMIGTHRPRDRESETVAYMCVPPGVYVCVLGYRRRGQNTICCVPIFSSRLQFSTTHGFVMILLTRALVIAGGRLHS